MVSGPQPDIDVVKDALRCSALSSWSAREPGMAQTVKLANNFLSASSMAATSEAIVMGVKAGHRSGDHDRRHQRRLRPHHGLERQIPQQHPAAHLRCGLRHRADAQGRAALRRGGDGARRAAPHDGHRARACGSAPRPRWAPTRTSPPSFRRSKAAPASSWARNMSDDIHEVFAVCLRQPRAQALGELHLRRSARRDDVDHLLRLGRSRARTAPSSSIPASTKRRPRSAAARSCIRSARV